MQAVHVPALSPVPGVHMPASVFALHSPFTGTLSPVHLEQKCCPLISTLQLLAAQFVASGLWGLHGAGSVFALLAVCDAQANCRAKLAKMSLSNIGPQVAWWRHGAV